MERLEQIKTILQNHLGEDKIKKIGINRYFINSGLVINENFDTLSINLVKVNGAIYFADYGETFKAYDKKFKDFKENEKQKLNQIFLENDIMFDGENILKKISNGQEYLDYNIFVKIIILLEFFLERF